jgi:hypothetical protein
MNNQEEIYQTIEDIDMEIHFFNIIEIGIFSKLY